MIHAQVLIERKSLDPVAVTAEETLRRRFDLDPVLHRVERRRVAELHIDADSVERVSGALEGFLEETFSFWNPNRERAWLRVIDRAGPGPQRVREIGRGDVPSYGTADLAHTEDALDHLVVWIRQDAPEPPVPGDLRRALRRLEAPWRFHEAECFTFRWNEAADMETRRDRLHRIGVVRSRHEGFFVHPHFQEHREFFGALPLPVWTEVRS